MRVVDGDRNSAKAISTKMQASLFLLGYKQIYAPTSLSTSPSQGDNNERRC
jgi:hypothetical protein